MWKKTGVAIMPGIIVLLSTAVHGKTKVTEPSIQPVYIKEGNQLTLKCIQDNNYKITWLRKLHSNATLGYRNITADSGFDQKPFGHNGWQVNILVKKKVEAEDSGSYRCDVTSGRDTSFNVEVYVIILQGKEGIMSKLGEGTTLECNIQSKEPITAKFDWFRNNQTLDSEPNKYKMESPPEHNHIGYLHISKTGEADVGLYTCHVTLRNGMNFTHTVHLFSYPHIRSFEKSKTLVEGEDLSLECHVWGWPIPTVAWFRNNVSLSTSSRVDFKNASLVAGAGLLVRNVTSADRANYACVATALVNGTNHTGNASIFIRIKGRMAPLYPLLGIVAEMIVLLVIILIYERQRRKKRARELTAESADDLYAD